MPKSMLNKPPSSEKAKYHTKTASESAIYTTWIRTLDMEDLFAEYVWLQISAFDLSELGLGLLYSILPIDFEPYSIDFTFELPTPEETLQGIWVKFKPIAFEKLYIWMTDFREYVIENFKEEFQTELLLGTMPKAIYGCLLYTSPSPRDS